MKRRTTMLTTVALLVAAALPSWAQERALPTQTTTISGTIETIDTNKRAMNIKTADGSFVAVNVPDTVQRFNEFKVGDKIQATYNNNVMVRVKPPGEAPVDSVDTTNNAKNPTSGSQGIVRRMTADVVAIDRAQSSISFEGPNGWKYSRRVVDPMVFAQVKVGDKVDIIWNTDLTVTVQ